MSATPLWTTIAMAEAMRASINGALPEAISGLSIDSRTIAPGEAYFAIKGDVHDGHDFVAAALKAGAALAVVGAATAVSARPAAGAAPARDLAARAAQGESNTRAAAGAAARDWAAPFAFGKKRKLFSPM